MIDKHMSIINTLNFFLSEKESCAGAKIGAALVYKNDIIVMGYNKYKSHPLMAKFFKLKKNGIFLHAEVDALIKASKILKEKQFSKSNIYVCRVLKNNELGLAKPCNGCIQVIKSFNVSKVYYTTGDYNLTYKEEIIDNV